MSIKSAVRRDRIGNQLIAKSLQGGNLATGADAQAVRWVERLLKLAGFNPGTVDNKFDNKTAAALRQFQAARGLPTTGALDKRTFEHLKRVQTRVRTSGEQPVFGAGQRHAAVTLAQKRLRALGYEVGKPDGVYDLQTAEAVKQYKADQGKEFKHASGELGVAGRKSLAREVRGLADAPERRRVTGEGTIRQYKRLDKLTAAEVARQRSVPVLGADGKPRLDANGVAVTRKLTGIGVGDKGRAVKNIEARLVKAGYNVGKADGRFDSRTEAALKAFQRKSGLEPTGRVGPQTWEKLRKSVILARDGFGPAQRLGERSASVKRTERVLQRLGLLDKNKVDGLFDKDTLKAVRQFERRHKIEVDGVVGRGQFRKMQRVLKARQNPLGRGKVVTGYRNGSPYKLSVYDVGGGQYMARSAGVNYLKMVKAARRAGIPLSNTSGFRTNSEQAALYRKYGPGRAARPGYSNHQQGLSMDIGGVNSYGTRAYAWLRANAGKYGFRNDVAGEWWHWTYYGR